METNQNQSNIGTFEKTLQTQLSAELKSLPVTVLQSVDSTNNYLKKQVLAAKSKAEGTKTAAAPRGSINFAKQVGRQGASTNAEIINAGGLETACIALSQTAGRGRQGRSFYSPEGTGIYMSMLVRPSKEAKEATLLTTLAAVATCKAIETVCHRKTSIKWVNDIYIDGKKVVGILTEAGYSAQSNEKLDYAIVGIGVNIWEPEGGFPKDIQDIAGAINPDVIHAKNGIKVVSKDQLRATLAAAILNEFQLQVRSWEKGKVTSCMDEYRKRSLVLGKKVELLTPDHTALHELVTVTQIGDMAELIITDSKGEKRTILSGEVSIQLVQ